MIKITKFRLRNLDNKQVLCLYVVLFQLLNNTPQSTNYTATYLPSRKLYKLDKPDMQDTAGEAGTSS